MLLSLLACAGTKVVQEPNDNKAWTVSIAATFSDAAPWHLRGRVETAPARFFRDGSQSVLVRLMDFEEAPSPEGPWLRAGLDGRSVEMRRFETGEILDLAGLHHVAGAPRHGDVIDLLYVALSPSPPRMSEGDKALRRSAWPFLLRKNVGWRQALVATWTHHGGEGNGPTRRVKLSYDGTLEGTGEDSRFEHSFTVKGDASGEVVVDGAGHVLAHTLDWSRTIVRTGGIQRQQTQTFQLSLEAAEAGVWMAPEPRFASDDAPLTNYLDPQDVHDALIPQLTAFETCYTHSGAAGRTEVGEVFIDFTISPDGSVRNGTVRDSRSGFDELDDCLAETANTLRFPAHDEEPMNVGYPLVWRQSALQAYPMVFVQDRPVGELFLRP